MLPHFVCFWFQTAIVASVFGRRMNSIILCSPSPGTSWPENIICTFFQSLSSQTFLVIKNCKHTDRRAMKGVPGVMQFESKCGLVSVGSSPPVHVAQNTSVLEVKNGRHQYHWLPQASYGRPRRPSLFWIGVVVAGSFWLLVQLLHPNIIRTSPDSKSPEERAVWLGFADKIELDMDVLRAHHHHHHQANLWFFII